MDERFRRCIEERKLVKIRIEKELVVKELKAAEEDLISAENSIRKGDYKWATIQSYYSMFHTARSLVLSRGYREKSHLCLSVALRNLFANRLEEKYFNNLRDCMALREDADYGLIYSELSSKQALTWARDFIHVARLLI
ncbi:MAG: HEPN domain-containing protein [Candidatus Micrarchaeota archaeon]